MSINPTPCITMDVINNSLKEHGVENITNWDALYVVPASRDEPQAGMVHGEVVKALNDYERIINEYSLHYEPETFDCDDFAHTFKTIFALHRINSIAYAVGELYDSNDKRIGLHAFNLMPWALHNNISCLVWLVVEPQLTFPEGVAMLRNGEARMFGYRYKVLRVEI